MYKMSAVLCLTSFLACWQFSVLSYPMHGRDHVLDGYRMQLAKRTPNLQDSLLSAFIRSEMPEESPNQRKKAIDSTFIRFGRSSYNHKNVNFETSPSSADSDYFSGSKLRKDEDISGQLPIDQKSETNQQEQIEPSAYFDTDIPKDCLLMTKKDLFRALMDKACIKRKVKRESVNDTFIRFGKRSVPEESPEVSDSDFDSNKEIRYGR